MIDQVNYIDYFTNSPDLEWLDFFASPDSVMGFISRLFTEEPVWLLWTSALGIVFPPDPAVRITVAMISLLVVLAARDFRHPWLGILLWMVVPYGLAVVGVYQIRQGFAFAVLFYFGARHGRLIAASLGAAMIHTTFAVVLPFAILARLRVSPRLKVALALAIAVALASVGGALFEEYGGRRIETYLVDEGTTSLNFLLGLLIPLPFMAWFYLTGDKRESGYSQRPVGDFALLYVGIVSFMAVSVFLFPLGTARLSYYASLGLIPVLASIRYGKILQGRLASVAVLTGVVPIMVFLCYLSLKAVEDDRYACLTTKNCADMLFSK